ncbi:hypothetical protein JTB14_015733 [Gonioctena quinquepunctata]|nr:hypothetical protein JTB14_015733 [Gonioctena quinquepunctata]
MAFGKFCNKDLHMYDACRDVSCPNEPHRLQLIEMTTQKNTPSIPSGLWEPTVGSLRALRSTCLFDMVAFHPLDVVLAPRLRHKGHDFLHFSFSNSITKFQVSNATLFLYIKGTGESSVYQDVIVDIFKVRKITDHFEPAVLSKVIGRKIPQPSGKGDWVKIDFTQTVSEWFKNPRENHGFLVNATVNGRKVAVTDVNVDKGKKIPYLEISTYESKRRVRRNTALNCDDSSQQTVCCRYPLLVDFGSIGFDFIIAPRTFNSYMCSGECSFLTLQKYLHTHLKQITMPDSSPPCCTPRKLGSISMLYFDEHLNILSGSMPGIVVEKCGCL